MVTGATMVIKDVLREELQNSIGMKKNYERELKKLPAGSLIGKKVKGNTYYYIVSRVSGKVQFKYLGRHVVPNIVTRYQKAKGMRVKYRSMLAQVKRQIKFLKGTLRGKQPV